MVSQQTPGQDKMTEENSQGSQEAPCYAAATDPGCERENNEDRFLALATPAGFGYFVFDGMGGEPGGEAAAQISADVIREYLQGAQPSDVEKLLCAAIDRAQQVLIAQRQAPHMRGMGTTVVGVFMRGSQLAIAAVGDSRAYCISDSGVTQITCDHTLVQELVDSGQIAPQDALVHPQSHVLTRCLGSDINSRVDSKKLWLWPPHRQQRCDSLLLCSDGLYSLVNEDEIIAIVHSSSPVEAARSLIKLARERGGFDNITVVIIPLLGTLKAEAFPIENEQMLMNRDDAARADTEHIPNGVTAHPSTPQGVMSEDLEQASMPSTVTRLACNVFFLSFIAMVVAVLSFAFLTMFKG
jgi:protein phosphatase